MLFGSRVKHARNDAKDLIEQARETGEGLLGQARETGGEALATVGERLGVYRPPPASTSGEDALAFINGLVLGIVICAIVAFLLAPTDGQTLRRRLKSQLDALLGRTPFADTAPAADTPESPGMAMSGAAEPAAAGA